MRRDQQLTLQRLAGRSLGVVTTEGLLSVGLTRNQVYGAVHSGILVAVHRGVLRLAASELSLPQCALAACFAAGSGAVVSHRTAAELWGLLTPIHAAPHVTIPADRYVQRAGIVVHRTTTLSARDVTRLGPVPIMRIPRTLATLQTRDLEPALDEALRRRAAAPEQLLGFTSALDKLVRDRIGLSVPESELERRAIALLRKHRLPEPVRQFVIGQYRVDLAYPDAHLAIELDGRAPHWGHQRWQADVRRQNTIELAGWRVLRFTWWDVTEHPNDVAASIAKALRARARTERSSAR